MQSSNFYDEEQKKGNNTTREIVAAVSQTGQGRQKKEWNGSMRLTRFLEQGDIVKSSPFLLKYDI